MHRGCKEVTDAVFWTQKWQEERGSICPMTCSTIQGPLAIETVRLGQGMELVPLEPRP